MKTLLYVNACVTRAVASRTNRLAQAYLDKCKEKYQIKTVVLEQLALTPLTGEGLAKRDEAIRKGDFSDEAFDLARDFAEAEEVVIAAPYWDMSFPALVKLYLEQLCVNRLTFQYDETGRPRSLVNLKKLVYITTSGGPIGEANLGFDYVKALFSKLFEVTDFAFFSAEGLDLWGNDPEAILATAIETLHAAE